MHVMTVKENKNKPGHMDYQQFATRPTRNNSDLLVAQGRWHYKKYQLFGSFEHDQSGTLCGCTHMIAAE